MSKKDLINLLNRAAAGFETPDDLTEEEKTHLVEDLVVAATMLERPSDELIATTCYVREDQYKKLKDLSGRTGVPVAEYVRRGIELRLEKEQP